MFQRFRLNPFLMSLLFVKIKHTHCTSNVRNLEAIKMVHMTFMKQKKKLNKIYHVLLRDTFLMLYIPNCQYIWLSFNSFRLN